MTINEKIAEYKADIEKCERVCAVTTIGSIREAATKKAEDCEQMVEWLEDYKRLKTEHGTVRVIRANIMRLQKHEIFPYEGNIYVDRDEVMRIFDKYTEGDEGNEKHNCT